MTEGRPHRQWAEGKSDRETVRQRELGLGRRLGYRKYERQRQQPCGQKDNVTEGWRMNLKKREEGDAKKRKPREQTERRQVDREMQDIQVDTGRETGRDGQTLVERQN